MYKLGLGGILGSIDWQMGEPGKALKGAEIWQCFYISIDLNIDRVNLLIQNLTAKVLLEARLANLVLMIVRESPTDSPQSSH